jgi:hypothetical protein
VLSEMVADHFAPSGKWRPQIWEFKLGLAGISFLQNLLPIGLFFYYNILFPPLMQCLIPSTVKVDGPRRGPIGLPNWPMDGPGTKRTNCGWFNKGK